MSTQRTITVYATKGQRMAKVETSAATWKELKPQIEEKGYDLKSLHATESVNRTDLSHQDAKLPEGNFTLFLRPKKTKSGIEGTENMGFKDLRAEVKKVMANDNGHATAHFNSFVDGKNYTQLSTDQLRAAVAAYTPPAKEEAVKADNGVGEVVESVKESAEATQADSASVADEHEPDLTPSEKVERAISLLEEVCDDTQDEDICDRVDIIVEDAKGLIQDLKDWENPQAAAERKAEEERIAKEKEEEEKVKQEAADLMNGFD